MDSASVASTRASSFDVGNDGFDRTREQPQEAYRGGTIQEIADTA